MPLVNFSNIDFNEIKESIKSHLRANSNFTDYDFQGSNLSTIIDTLAYNTYITSYNANMVTNEVFLDSATLRENVVSLARNIGYIPRPRRSSSADIEFSVDVSGQSISSVTLKAGIVCISKRGLGKSFVFSITEDITVGVDLTGRAIFPRIRIYEGTYIKQSYTVSSKNKNQRYLISNPGADTTTMNVVVSSSESSGAKETYNQYNSLIDLKSTSNVYFLQEIDGERYEIMFGDGLFGRKLEEPNFIEIGYILSSGSDGNDINNFSFAGNLVDNDGASISSGISLISTINSSSNGASIESVDSIKKYASQIYSSQNRAVTSSDYEALIPRIYPEVQSISAFGGETLTPPQFGKVFISIKPKHGDYLSVASKEEIKNEIKKYSVSGIVTEILDLRYIYLEPTSKVYYNTNLSNSSSIIKNNIINNITKYANSTEMNKFGARFKYSKYQKLIDDSNEAITSNITTIVMRRDMRPSINQFAEYELCYGNRFHIKSETGYNIKSSGFKVSGISNTVYLTDIPNSDLKKGKVFLFYLESPEKPITINKSVGVIDYIKGEIKLNPINIISTEVNRDSIPLIEVSVSPYSNDVIGLHDLYMQLDLRSTLVTMISDRILSGNDTSGSDYIVSSSYSNGSFTR